MDESIAALMEKVLRFCLGEISGTVGTGHEKPWPVSKPLEA